MLFSAPCNQGGVLVPNPGNCESFLTCVHDKFLAQSCQSGLHFDNIIKACNFLEAANCDGSSVSGSEGEDSGVVSVGDKDK